MLLFILVGDRFIYLSIYNFCLCLWFKFYSKFKKIKKYVSILITVFLLSNSFSMIKNHPYQFVFYNQFISNKNLKNFELDYYGVSI